jgi:hypothetical protein
MEAQIISETLDYSAILTRLIAWEYFITYSHRESFKSYRVGTEENIWK